MSQENKTWKPKLLTMEKVEKNLPETKNKTKGVTNAEGIEVYPIESGAFNGATLNKRRNKTEKTKTIFIAGERQHLNSSFRAKMYAIFQKFVFILCVSFVFFLFYFIITITVLLYF